jgi:hypothetical protein
MIYIQRRDNYGLETVDEFSTRREARAMLAEYQFSDRAATYYLSQRPCKHWKN